MTLLLARSDLLAVLDPDACLAPLSSAFLATDPTAPSGNRLVAEIPFPGTATALIPGLLPGVDAYTVKVNAKFPAARPALRGVICLHAADGELLALLDSATITAWRTGLSAALALRTLGVPEGRLGVIGAGAQAEITLLGLHRLRSWPTLTIHDSDPVRAASFASRHGATVAPSARAVSAASELVLLATWSRTLLLSLADTHEGQHLTTLGADEPGKCDLSPDLLAAASLTVDHLPLVRTSGILTDPALKATPLATHPPRGAAPGPPAPLRPRPGRPPLAGPRALLVRLPPRVGHRPRHLDRLPRMTAGGGSAGRSNTRFRLWAGVV